MAKKVRVALFGEQRRNIKIDADATEGAVVGLNLKWSDGTVVTEAELRGRTPTTTTTPPGGTVWTGPVLWSLIIGIPALIKSLATLTATGLMRHRGAGVVTADDWPYVRNSIQTGEALTIPAGHQLLVWENFTFNGGAVTIEGDLVIL